MAEVHINKMLIVKTEPAETNLGNGATYRTVRKLTMKDGTVLYGCVECEYDYAANNPMAVAAHVRTTHRVVVDITAIKDITITDLIRAAADHEVANNANEWKTRALAAERDLAKLRKILGAS